MLGENLAALSGLFAADRGRILATGALIAFGRRLVRRDQLIFAIADQIGAAHPLQGFAQHRPPLGVVIAQKGLVKTTLFLTFNDGHAFALIGDLAQRVLAAAASLRAQGISCGVLHCHTVKPLDEQLILDLASNVELIVTVEEHILNGGLGTAVLETLVNNVFPSMPRIVRLGLPQYFVEEYGSQDTVLESFGLSPEMIATSTRNHLS